METNKSVEYQR